MADTTRQPRDTPGAADRPRPPQRLATAADAPQISALMRASVLELFPRYYDERQTASAAVHIAHGLGRAILDACERAARAEGFTRLVLGATLPGEPLYRACGFRELGRVTVTLPDGVSVECVAMERPIEPLPA